MPATRPETAMQANRGFTLAELMVALTLTSILLAVAVPTYGAYMLKARRAEGRTALLLAMQQQERFYSLHNTYAAFSASAPDPGGQFRWWSGASAGASAYELDAAACPDTDLRGCVEIRALPGTGRVDTRFRDPDCGTLVLRSSGERGAQGDADRCWR